MAPALASLDRYACEWPLILASLWLGAWAVRAAAGVDLERPNQLVDSGPYAHSRNPMYLAWTLGYVGIARLPAPPGRSCSCRSCCW